MIIDVTLEINLKGLKRCLLEKVRTLGWSYGKHGNQQDRGITRDWTLSRTENKKRRY